jgi:hypothetical protein
MVVGIGVISDASNVLCGVSCEEGEQATIKKIDTATVANGPSTLEYFLNLIFPLPLSHTLDNRNITCYNSIGGDIVAPTSMPVNWFLVVRIHPAVEGKAQWAREREQQAT